MVAWSQVCRPYEFGGLGVKNLAMQGLALRVRWEWLRRTDPHRPWQGLQRLKDVEASQVFDSLICIQVGEGSRVLFWSDRWMRGLNASQIAPLVVQEVSTQCINRRTVQEGLLNNRWIGDIRGVLSPQGMIQCFALLAMVATIFRDEQQPDSFTWPWSASGNYSATSTYRMLKPGGYQSQLG